MHSKPTFKSAEHYLQFDLERDAAIAEKNARRGRSDKQIERDKRLEKAKEDAQSMYFAHGTAPVIRISDGKVFYSKSACCRELMIKLAYLNRMLSYGEFRIATIDEARDCIAEELARKAEPKSILSAHNKRVQKEAYDARRREAADKRLQQRFSAISFSLRHVSTGTMYESVTAAMKGTGLSRYIIMKQIHTNDGTWMVLTKPQFEKLKGWGK